MSDKKLFPAQAGVIPVFVRLNPLDVAVPRASGGDPILNGVMDALTDCSPRKRG